MGKFAQFPIEAGATTRMPEAFCRKSLEVLVEQLGHKTAEARLMIGEALDRNSAIVTPRNFLMKFTGEYGKTIVINQKGAWNTTDGE